MKNDKQIQLLSDLIEGAGLELRTDYSGRGMFGDQCLAFDYAGTTPAAIADMIISAREWSKPDEALDELVSALQHARQDSMGLGSVMYFPLYGTGINFLINGKTLNEWCYDKNADDFMDTYLQKVMEDRERWE